MAVRRPLARRQRLAIVNGMLAFALMLVILQLWLLPATNANLGRDTTVVRPAAVAGVPCLLLNAGLLRNLYQLDRDHR